jgi:hypothetical protein
VRDEELVRKAGKKLGKLIIVAASQLRVVMVLNGYESSPA